MAKNIALLVLDYNELYSFLMPRTVRIVCSAPLSADDVALERIVLVVESDAFRPVYGVVERFTLESLCERVQAHLDEEAA